MLRILLTTAASATDAASQKRIYESVMITLIISNEEIEDIMKRYLYRGVRGTIKNEGGK